MIKLIRDRIPELYPNSKIKIIKENAEYFDSLKNKLLEEVNEFIEASSQNNDSHIVEEIADILEVIDAICKLKKYDTNLVQDVKLKKKQERGGFEKRILLLEKN
ncbi:MAG: nucleoside triphosphate pyrophosphohydrolase [Candidatus Babeliales bacterium]